MSQINALQRLKALDSLLRTSGKRAVESGPAHREQSAELSQRTEDTSFEQPPKTKKTKTTAARKDGMPLHVA